MNFSAYQIAIFDFIANTVKNLLVRAGAGSGKTTTLVEIVKRLAGQTIFLAFNKSIAEELKRRGVNARTFHSLCFGPVTRFCKARGVESNKIRNLIDDRFGDEEKQIYGSFVARLVGLGRNAGIGCLIDDTEANWDALAAKHDLELESTKADWAKALQYAHEILVISNVAATQSALVDFDDLLYIAVKEGISLPKFDNVLVDEAQDTNAIQRAILRKIMKPESRLVAVGDSAQAIYGFRGADSDAMDLIRTEFECEELPLTVSYRCATAIVEHASKFGLIEAAPGAAEGKVSRVDRSKELTESMVAGDLVVCRTTKPIIEFAYALLKARKPAYVMGRDIGQGLVNLIRKQQAKGIEALITKLTDSTQREVERAIAKGDDAKAERAQERCDCILFLIDNLPENDRTVPALIRLIEELFADKAGAVILATVHKAKGLEANRVYWLNHDYVCRWARQPWQKQQEKNLCYVAATRAKSELILIPSPQKTIHQEVA